jgi:hypothetical protein
MNENLINKIKKNNKNNINNHKSPIIEKLEKNGILNDEYDINNNYPEEVSLVDTLKHSRDYQGNDNYIGLEKNVRDIAKLNMEMNRKLLAGKSIPYKVFVYSTDFIKTKVLGKNAYSIEEIFDKQLFNIKELNSNLTNIIFNSKKELKNLIIYRDEIIKEWDENMQKYKKLDKEGNLKNELYLEAEKEFNSTKKGDKKYFTLMKACKNLRRDLKRISHNKYISANNVKDRDNENMVLEDLEEMLTTGIEVCETISDKTKGILRYVNNTKKQWDTLVSQGRITEALYKSVAMLGEYSNNLHEKLNEGIKRMGGIAANPNILNSYYLRTHKGIKQIADGVSSTHLNKVGNLDVQMEDYVNQKQNLS